MAGQDERPLVGIDLGGTKIALAVGTPEGRILARRRRPTEPSGDPAKDVARMAEDTRALLDEAGLAPGDCAGLGLSVPGPVDPLAGRVLHPPNLKGWGEVPLRDWLFEALGLAVHLENDANAAALAEWRFGAGQGSRHCIYLTMSTGVGGGILVNGRIHHGLGSMAGEIGHIPIEWEGERCACGQRGCLEAYIGGASWARRLQRITPPDSRAAVLAGSPDRVRPEELVRAAGEGDAFALAEMARFNDYLARALVILGFVLAPEVVVLGTIAVAAGEALCLDPVREKVRARSWAPIARGMQIRTASLGPDLPYLSGLCAALSGAELEAEAAARESGAG